MKIKYDIILNTITNKIGIPSEVYLSQHYGQDKLKKIYTLSEFNREIQNGAIVSDSTVIKINNKETTLFLEY
jgi:hypothetical protein